MKAISEILAAVLVILISMVCVALVLEFSSPSLGRLKEVSLFQEGQKILTDINNAVRAVTQEGSGSTRVLQLSISGGEYFIDTENNAVIFSMESRAQIIGIGLSKTEGDINMYGELNMVYLNISYDNIDVTGNETFGKGYHNLIIRNNGYNQTSNKQMISITTKPPVLPPTVIFNSYNQFGTPYIVRGEKTAGNYIDLNSLGEGLTYDITENGTKGYYNYQRRPNTYGGYGASSQIQAYNYDNIGATQSGATSQADWWNNTPQNPSGDIVRAIWGTKYRGTGSGTGNRNDDSWGLLYGTASTPGDCNSVTSWVNLVSGIGSPGSTWQWRNITNISAVTGDNINNTCWRMTYTKNGPQDTWVLEVDGFHVDVNYSISDLRVEVWHNSTTISYSGTLSSIDAILNFTSNVSDTYSLQIYDWKNYVWVSTYCDSGNVLPSTPTQWWCNMTISPENYISQASTIRIRLSSNSDNDIGLLKEDYVQYYVGYIP